MTDKELWEVLSTCTVEEAKAYPIERVRRVLREREDWERFALLGRHYTFGGMIRTSGVQRHILLNTLAHEIPYYLHNDLEEVLSLIPVFELEGYEKKEMSALLNERGLRSPTGKAWAYATLMSVLRSSPVPKSEKVSSFVKKGVYLQTKRQKAVEDFYCVVYEKWQQAVKNGCYNTGQVVDYFNRIGFKTRAGNDWHRWSLTIIMKSTAYDWTYPVEDKDRELREAVLSVWDRGWVSITDLAQEISYPKSSVSRVLKKLGLEVGLENSFEYRKWRDEVFAYLKSEIRKHVLGFGVLAKSINERGLSPSYNGTGSWYASTVSRFFYTNNFCKDHYYAESVQAECESWLSSYSGSNHLEDLGKHLSSSGYVVPLHWEPTGMRYNLWTTERVHQHRDKLL